MKLAIEERDKMIDALINHTMQTMTEENIIDILRDGYSGFDDLSDEELKDEYDILPKEFKL